MRRRAPWAAAAALLLAMGCGVPTDPSPRQIPADRVPFDLLNPEPAPRPSTP
ncbi:MAG TPA: hypothetical protein VM388_15020 [Acidimicrobiales bacterium]|nr:hypothetical protein [Acidimicrobiales bacterium]HWI05420.1 hypothetical protein [Acidimicrobiales bacterium]